MKQLNGIDLLTKLEPRWRRNPRYLDISMDARPVSLLLCMSSLPFRADLFITCKTNAKKDAGGF